MVGYGKEHWLKGGTMVIICDPPRHAIYIHFGSRATLWMGPQLRFRDETVGLFVDDAATPSLLRGVLFYRHRFYLPFLFASEFAVTDFSIRCTRKDHIFQCGFTQFTEDHNLWQVHRGVEVLVQSAEKAGKERPTLIGFKVDTSVLTLDMDPDSMCVEFGADNLKTN
jgi:hypothetical protein